MTVQAIDAEKDVALWQHQHGSGARLSRPTLAADLGLIVFLEVPEETRKLHGGARYPAEQAQAVVALNVADGSLAWRMEVDPNILDLTSVASDYDFSSKKNSKYADYFHQVAYRNGKLFCLNANDANGGKPGVVWAIDVKSGKSDWIGIVPMPGSYDMFPLADGTLFVFGSGWYRFDQASGAVVARGGLGVNARCDTGAASENLILAGFGNVFDVTNDKPRRRRHDLAPGQCGGWGTPAYGMVYHHGSGCGCLCRFAAIWRFMRRQRPSRLPMSSAYYQAQPSTIP